MAVSMDNNLTTYEKEKEMFMRDLKQLHETSGTPLHFMPKISGREIDLYLLYTLVTKNGGWVKVNSRNDWGLVLDEMNLPVNGVNCAVAIKQLYLRYLEGYEKVNFPSEMTGQITEDYEDIRHKRTTRNQTCVPLSYNYSQHNFNESLREVNGLSVNLYKPSEYDKLGLSLLCPLVNEQDFAINVCTLLSNEGRHCLKLEKHPRILHYLLAHAAVFCHPSLRHIFTEYYSQSRKHSLTKFWDDVLCESNLQRLIDESKFEKSLNELCGCDSETLTSGCDNKGLSFDTEDKDLFCLGRTLGTQDYVGQRILQIATILRNLTLIPENLTLMFKDITFLRFVLLCCGSRWNTLHQMGWDMLGNIAMDLSVQCPLMPEILNLTVKGLFSEDRAEIISSLEVLNKIGQNEKNEESLLKHLTQPMYEKVCSFLTIHDIMLLIYTLECLNTLSSLGEKACNYILKTYGILDTLVSLITAEAQSYGPKACIQMRVVETVSGPISSSDLRETSMSTSTTIVNERPPVPLTSSIQGSYVAPVAPMPLSPSVNTLVRPTPIRTTTPTAPVIQRPAQNPQNSPVQSTFHVVQENKQFAFSWIKNILEVNQSGRVEEAELYKQYINHCAKIGRRGVIAPLHFPQCVKSVFGLQISVKTITTGDISRQFYEGVQFRNKANTTTTPATINIATQPQEPQFPSTTPSILKAQLSAPLKPSVSTTQVPTKSNQIQLQQTLQASTERQISDQQTSIIVSESSNSSNSSGHFVITPSPKSYSGKLAGATLTSKALEEASSLNKKPVSEDIPLIGVKQTIDVPLVITKPIIDNVPPMIHSKSLACDAPVIPKPISDDVPSVDVKPVMIDPSEATPKEISEGSSVMSHKAIIDNINGKAPVVPQKDNIPKVAEIKSEGVITSTSMGSQVTPHLSSVLLRHLNHTSEKSNMMEIDKDTNASSNIARKSNHTSTESNKDNVSIPGIAINPNLETTGNKITLSQNINVVNKNTSKTDINIPTPRFNDKDSELLQYLNKDRVLSHSTPETKNIDINISSILKDHNPLKRSGEELVTGEPKKPRVNGELSSDRSEEGSVSSSAANLYAALAADTLEDEPVEETREKIQPVLVAPSSQGRQILLSSGFQIGQKVVAGGQHYVVAKPQSTIVQGQTQTVLVTQASQQGKASKTIIILQPQHLAGTAEQQKVIVQGLHSAQHLPLITTSAPNPMVRVKSPPKPSPASQPTPSAASMVTQHLTHQVPPLVPHEPVKEKDVKTSVVNNTCKDALPTVIQSPPSNTQSNPEVVFHSTPTGSPSQVSCSSKSNIDSPSKVLPSSKQEHFLCEWRGCMRSFKSTNEVYIHVCKVHCPQGNEEIQCLWERCDTVKRKRFSLMTHLFDRHCNPNVMQMTIGNVIRKKPLPVPAKTEPPSPCKQSTQPGYAPNAAFYAIKRHTSEYVNPKELQDDNEGPVTKSIRLTASLILRNLVIFSTNGRKRLTRFEPHLANVALSSVESSRTVAQVLFDLS